MVKRTLSAIQAHPWAVILTAAYLVLAVGFSVVNPIHEATDELRHYRYVRYIADYGQLPVQYGGKGNAQAHHPPLYYATAALASFWVRPPDPLYSPPRNPQWGFRNWEVSADNKNLYLHGPDEAWPYRGHALAAHLARWVTALWGAAAVALTYAIARTLIPERPFVAAAAMALIGFSPMFLYLGGAVNNDVPAGLMGAAITLVCLHVVRDGIGNRRALLLGALYGAAILVKFNLVAMLGVIELALTLALVPGRNAARRGLTFLRANGIILGAALAIGGWWYVRNTILYGEPTGFLRVTEIWGMRDPHAGIRLAGRDLLYAWTTLWARFGYGQLPLPDGFYAAAALLCGVGLLGLVIWLLIRRQEIGRARALMLVIVAASALTNFSVLVAYITVSPAGAMGRFFFPGLPAFATLVGLGLVSLLPGKAQPAMAAGVGAAMLAFTLTAMIGYLIPAYAIPAQVDPPPDPLNIMVGDAARILAYEIDARNAHPGGEIDVTVTWETLKPTDAPYAVFVHISNFQSAMIAQRDTYTGLGNYPSIWWQPDHVFTETYRVFLPETTYAPDDAVVRVGLYNPERGRLPIDHPGAYEAALWVGQTAIVGDPDAEYPNQTYINWGNCFALLGYTIEPRVLLPGQKTIITLYWLALDPPPDEDYKVFLHIVQGWDAKWAANDGPPVSGTTQTRYWAPGEIHVDARPVRLPGDIPPGIYEIEIGWFSDTDGARLDILAEDGHIIDDWLLLNTLMVVDE